MLINKKLVNRYIMVISTLDEKVQQAVIAGVIHNLKLKAKKQILKEIGVSFKEAKKAHIKGDKLQNAKEGINEIFKELNL